MSHNLRTKQLCPNCMKNLIRLDELACWRCLPGFKRSPLGPGDKLGFTLEEKKWRGERRDIRVRIRALNLRVAELGKRERELYNLIRYSVERRGIDYEKIIHAAQRRARTIRKRRTA